MWSLLGGRYGLAVLYVASTVHVDGLLLEGTSRIGGALGLETLTLYDIETSALMGWISRRLLMMTGSRGVCRCKSEKVVDAYIWGQQAWKADRLRHHDCPSNIEES